MAAPDTSGQKAAVNSQTDMMSPVNSPQHRAPVADELGMTDEIGAIGAAQDRVNNTVTGQDQLEAARERARQQNAALYQNGVSITGGAGNGLDAEQSSIAQQIISVGKQRGLSDTQIQEALDAGLTESGLHNLNYGDSDSLGIFQQRPSQGWGSAQQVTDPNYSIGKFYDALMGGSGQNPWNVVQSVQRSAFADGSNYQAQWQRAQNIYRSYQIGAASSPTVGANGAANWITNNTGKYEDYDGWYGAQCVDLYDFYSTGFVGASPNPVGYADEIWTNHDYNAYAQISANQIPQMGDVAVWGKGGNTPMSHVGIIIKDLGNGWVQTLSNNATSEGSNGASAVVTLSKASLLGYLRPRKLM
jgi:hypothetical protein